MFLHRRSWASVISLVILVSIILAACNKEVPTHAEGKTTKPETGAVTVYKKKAISKKSKVYYKDRVAVLMYHDLVKGKTTKKALSAEVFKKQMELLKTSGFRVIGMKEYSDFVLKGGKVPDNAVLITFDDGYESFYKLAYPVLKEYGYPATAFLIVRSIDERIGVPKMTWDQMREMQKDGMTFYSHTYDSHAYADVNERGKSKPALTARKYLINKKRQETKEEARQRIIDDLKKAEERLKEELGNTDSILCFPYGAYNDTVMEALKSLDIQISFTIEKGVNSRSDAKGFRINAAKVGMDPETTIGQLKKIKAYTG